MHTTTRIDGSDFDMIFLGRRHPSQASEESSTFAVMESTTQQLSTYPHIIPLAISEANHHRRQPKIRSMSDYEIQRLRRSDSFMNYNYHINTTSTRPRHMISGSSTPESKYRPHHRKGELRYDFRFGNGFEQKEDARFKHARHRRDRSSVFTVASARTLCSIPSEPPTPISPSPSFLDLYSPSLPPSPTVASNPAYATTSHSTLTPLELQDCINHGRYCRLKTFLLELLHLDLKLPSSASTPRSSMRTICNHKFHHGRCKRCDLSEAIFPYLGGGLLTSGFHCRDFGCEACSDMHVSVQEEEWAERTPSPLDISDEAPQIDPIAFIPISTTQPHPLDTGSDCASTSTPSSHSSFSFSPSLFRSTPLPRDTRPDLSPPTSPPNYSLPIPTHRPTHHTGPSTPCRARIPTGFARYISPSPESTSRTSVLGSNIPATAVAMLQASPTTVHIRQPHSRPGTAVQSTRSPSPLSTPVTEIENPLSDTPITIIHIRQPHSRPEPAVQSTPSPSPLSRPATEIKNPLRDDTTSQASPATTVIRHLHSQPGTAVQPFPSPPPTTTPTTEIENPLSDTAHSAPHSPPSPDSRTTILRLHRALSTSTSSTDTHLIRTARLVLGLAVQSAAGRIPADIAEKVSAQLFSEEGQEVMEREEFVTFVREAVERGEVSEVRGSQILELINASGEGDVNFVA
ncbi:hypothetical protein BKA58DRAFT_417018 [Alternaria rosae]|uniref:uncharacterized protein n=1 Tax=Alternaria rosae TaxID=1187941 RepID=UPI001E8CB836|nr:uncharacterized protein BKA58DRAFT_417018 [Alternaria rosae]KAH6883208.1 hypothetical protein BKA58DRAFT_417018 [Alternaria rosae]